MGNCEMEPRAYSVQEKKDFRPGAAQEFRTILPMGVTLLDQGIHVNVVSPGARCAVRFCLRNEEEPFLVKEFSPEERMGDVWSADISYEALVEAARAYIAGAAGKDAAAGKDSAAASGKDDAAAAGESVSRPAEKDVSCEEAWEALQSAEYGFENERGLFEDPYGQAFSGRDSWGKAEQYGNPLRSPLFLKSFDWEGDHPLRRRRLPARRL